MRSTHQVKHQGDGSGRSTGRSRMDAVQHLPDDAQYFIQASIAT